MNELFRKLAHTASEAAGSPWAFIVAARMKLAGRQQGFQRLVIAAEAIKRPEPF